MDCNRDVDKDSLTSFIETIEWRINNKITEEEFACIHLEWKAYGTKKLPTGRAAGGFAGKSVGIFALRQILIELNILEESKLDVYRTYTIRSESNSVT